MTDFEIAKFFGERAGVALLAGLIMGIERSISGHSAGIKTLVFVCMGSSIFSALSFYIADVYPDSDPTRIIGQIVTGVGFLGAGVIFRNDRKVSGLTSAAIVWVACSLGVVAGAGLFLVPIFASLTFVGVMYILKKFDKYLEKFEKKDSTSNDNVE